MTKDHILLSNYGPIKINVLKMCTLANGRVMLGVGFNNQISLYVIDQNNLSHQLFQEIVVSDFLEELCVIDFLSLD